MTLHNVKGLTHRCPLKDNNWRITVVMACPPKCDSLGIYNQRGIWAGSIQVRPTKWCVQSIYVGYLNNGCKRLWVQVLTTVVYGNRQKD